MPSLRKQLFIAAALFVGAFLLPKLLGIWLCERMATALAFVTFMVTGWIVFVMALRRSWTPQS